MPTEDEEVLDDWLKRAAGSNGSDTPHRSEEDDLPGDDELSDAPFDVPAPNQGPKPPTVGEVQDTGTVMLTAGDVQRLDAEGKAFVNMRVYDPTQATLLVCHQEVEKNRVPEYAMFAAALTKTYRGMPTVEGLIFLATERIVPQHPRNQIGVIAEPYRSVSREAASEGVVQYSFVPRGRTSLADYVLGTDNATLTTSRDTYFPHIVLLSSPLSQLNMLTAMVNRILHDAGKGNKYFLAEIGN